MASTLETNLIGATLVNRFRLDSILGEGSMGYLYGARDLMLDREVAVKTMKKELASRENFVAQFIREAKIIAQLSLNPHLLVIHDLCFMPDHRPFIVAERLHGSSLKSLLRDPQPPSRSWVLEIGVQVSLALLEIHSKGISHRDLSPGNVFIVKTDAFSSLAKLIDFGLSQSPQFAAAGNRLMYDGITGTLRYLAPEVIDGQEGHPPSDIYSFGVLLYEMATGLHPYKASSAAELIAAHRSATPSPEPLKKECFPETFTNLVITMLAKAPQDRPSAQQCLSGLRAADRELERTKGG